MAALKVAATSTFSLVSLKAEINNAQSPLHSAYAAFPHPDSEATDEQGIAALLNDPTNAGGGPIPNDPLSAASFRDCFDAGEALLISQSQTGALLFHFGIEAVDIGNPKKQVLLEAFLQNYPNTIAALQTAYTKTGSRAQVLWGPTVPPITDSQVQMAALLP